MGTSKSMQLGRLRILFPTLVFLYLSCLTIRPVAAICSARTQSQLIFNPEYTTWPTTTFHRSLQQVASAPDTGSNITNKHLILAEHRTARRDPLDRFHVYRQGWDIRNKDYWASVALTGAPGFVLAAVWLAVGLVHLLVLCCCCCCCRDSLKGSHQGGNLFPLLLLLIFTGAAVAGCVLVYTGQGKFYDELSDTLDYVVQQSETVVVKLRNVSAALAETQKIDVLNFTLSSSDRGQQIQQLSAQLNSAATNLETQTNENAHRIRSGLTKVRLAMVVVAGVMLLLVLLGFLVSTLGIMPLVYLLVFLGWFLVAGTWILCGVYIVLNNAIGDTCVAMKEWSANPSAQTSLSEIIPCVDISTTNKTLDETKRVTNETIMGINSVLATLNQGSSRSVPLLCNPVETQLSPPNCSNISDAPKEWLAFVCNNTSSPQTCPAGGKLTSQIYDQLNQSMNVINSIYSNTPFLLDLENCQFVRDVFNTITTRYCGPLRKYSKWLYIGLALTSGGCMFAIPLWVVFSKRRKHRFSKYAPVTGDHQFMTRGDTGPTRSKPTWFLLPTLPPFCAVSSSLLLFVLCLPSSGFTTSSFASSVSFSFVISLSRTLLNHSLYPELATLCIFCRMFSPLVGASELDPPIDNFYM